MYVSNLALPSTRLVIILLKRLRWRMTISNKELQRETFYGLNLSTSFQIHPHVHLPVRGHQAKNPGAILSQRNNWRLREMGPSIRLAAEGRQTALHFPLRQNRPRILGLVGGVRAALPPLLLLMVSMIVANSKEKWRRASWRRGFGITTEKDFAPYMVLQNNASKISVIPAPAFLQ